jgi:outer membrane protein assembly factor BamD
MNNRTISKWIIFVSLSLFFISGCGGKGKEVKKITGDPEILYKEGLVNFNKRDYGEAIKKFEELKSSFPDSPPFTNWAELKVGDCHFLQKEYVEAIVSYEEFKKIHPGHEEIPYVQFQIGMSYYNQMRTLDRDQTATKKALSSFENLVANSPPGLFTEKAKEKIDACKKRLAENDFYVANFYYKQGKFGAAASRLQELVQKYPKGPDEDKALYFLGKSYLELEQWEKAEGALMKVVTEYPKSPYYKEAKAILDKGLTEKKASKAKTKTKDSKKKVEVAATEPEMVSLVKFEEEGKQPVSLKEEKKIDFRQPEERLATPHVESEPVKSVPPKSPPAALSEPGQTVSPKEEAKPSTPVAIEPIQEKRAQAVASSPKPKPVEPIRAGEPIGENRSSAQSASKATPEKEKSAEERRTASLSSPGTSSKQKKEVLPKSKEANLVDKNQPLVDKGQPIDISSDKVEAFWKENLIVFKGNVIARQKDMVIYADSVEALIIDDGKGIERVTAGGNVKIQQGLRVANCQKAVFYNLDQKMILTGDPKVSEGDNIVSGEEIIFDIDKNRVEVKGGTSGRGKAKIQPGEIEKVK